jgi:hypothetical protein
VRTVIRFNALRNKCKLVLVNLKYSPAYQESFKRLGGLAEVSLGLYTLSWYYNPGLYQGREGTKDAQALAS